MEIPQPFDFAHGFQQAAANVLAFDIEDLGRLPELLGHLHIGRARRRVAGSIRAGLHFEIKSKIEERIRNVPEANRERAFINGAKTEAMNQTVRPVGNSVRP